MKYFINSQQWDTASMEGHAFLFFYDGSPYVLLAEVRLRQVLLSIGPPAEVRQTCGDWWPSLVLDLPDGAWKTCGDYT